MQCRQVGQQVGLLVSTVAVATLSLLLTDTSLEAAWDMHVDITRNLRALGQGNLLTAVAGGLMGGHLISRSLLNRASGARSRNSGVILAVLCLLAMVWGDPVLAQVPRPLPGALLIYQGIDYLTIVALVAITAIVGFLPAVCVGIMAYCSNPGIAPAAAARLPARPGHRYLGRAFAREAPVERTPSSSEHGANAGRHVLHAVAAARAEGVVELLALSRERLHRLMQESPELALALFRLFVMQMAGRVEQLGMQASALAR